MKKYYYDEFEEREDEYSLENEYSPEEEYYYAMKEKIRDGEFDTQPSILLEWYVKANANHDWDLSDDIEERVKSDWLKAEDIAEFYRNHERCSLMVGEMLNFLVVRDYFSRKNDNWKYDDVSAQQCRRIVISVAIECSSSRYLLPIIRATYYTDQEEKLDAYREFFSIVCEKRSEGLLKKYFYLFGDYVRELNQAGLYREALDMASHEFFAQRVEDVIGFVLALCESALKAGDENKLDHYLKILLDYDEECNHSTDYYHWFLETHEMI